LLHAAVQLGIGGLPGLEEPAGRQERLSTHHERRRIRPDRLVPYPHTAQRRHACERADAAPDSVVVSSEKIQLLGDTLWMGPVVVILAGDVLPGCDAEAQIPSSIGTSVPRGVDNVDPFIHPSDAVHDSLVLWRRRIIDK